MLFLKKIFRVLTHKERILLFVAAGIIALSAIAILVTVITKGTTPIPAAGGEYTEGIAGQPEYINPVTATSETDRDLVKMVYSNIYDIADKITVSSDTKTWTIRLKENLHWQDGEQLTSDDVIFTVNEIQNKDAASPLFSNWQGVSVSRTSELELQFSLAKSYAFFGDDLKGLYILPKHLFAAIPPGNWRLSDYNLKPVGSGPYIFSSYEMRPDGYITAYHLKAWDDYFGIKPLIDNFDFDFLSDNAALIKSFNSAQIDGFGGSSAGDLASIGRPHDTYVFRTPSYYAVFLNQTANPALGDSAVRQALSLSVDRNALVQNALNGYGEPDYGPIPPDAPYNTSISTTTSLDLASTTLDNAGWKMGDNGFRAKTVQKSAVPLAITITVPQIEFLTETADSIKNAWQQIGVQVTINTVSPEDVATNAIPNRDYDALLFGNILGPSSDLYSFWDSSQDLFPGLNLAMYNNPKVDTLLNAIRANPDDAARTAQFASVQNIIASDTPAVFLYSTDYLYVTDKSVHGITTSTLPDPTDRFNDVGDWYLNTTRVLK